MRLLDFHTHLHNIERYRGDSTVIAVRSLMPDEETDDRSDLYTVGIHPMDEQRYADPEGLLLRRIDELGERFLGIGECGWDRRSSWSMEEQTALVRRHILLADQLCCPLILHVVGGWHLLLRERRAHPEGVWVVHGFRGKPALLRQLEEAHIEVSLHPQYRWEEVPRRPFFLESDESSIPLTEIYSRASGQLGVSVSSLAEAILRQFPLRQ
ncbi:MAG: TatD family hydrolase [Porphyromonas sp.]|uniref:TatD family hydrolase n=1 Tax=Porphyromonas sp. TaxID=1924944 RepID=UPI002A914373|nr:TatD family hydrolase [Porphyromonas sp.]MDD7468590.1 TatD family hydrolase [Bacteroidales bacterium]MDY6101964.1 TatD family hydrolase [Porphyromonas sp.]